jgi:hypothetical protein
MVKFNEKILGYGPLFQDFFVYHLTSAKISFS